MQNAWRATRTRRTTVSHTETIARIDPTIRPFKFRASDDALVDLKRRITVTRWPSKELVAM